MFVAEKVLLLLVISLTVLSKGSANERVSHWLSSYPEWSLKCILKWGHTHKSIVPGHSTSCLLNHSGVLPVHVLSISHGDRATTHATDNLSRNCTLHPESLPEAAHYSWCISLTFTGLISSWRRGEASSAILAKSLSDSVAALCVVQGKSRHLKVCEILKMTCYFQTNWMFYILNWDVRCLCCRWRRFQVLLSWASPSNCPPLNWRTSLTT